MQEVWHVIWHAFLDTLKMSWLLLLFYILIELIEQKIAVKMHKKLKSKYAVAAGAGFGIVPQCGFSVLATDLFAKKQITVGTLIAVYIATSDEALPLLFSSIGEKGVWLKLILLIVSKLILALVAGYALDGIVTLAVKKKGLSVERTSDDSEQHTKNQDAAEEDGHGECSVKSDCASKGVVLLAKVSEGESADCRKGQEEHEEHAHAHSHGEGEEHVRDEIHCHGKEGHTHSHDEDEEVDIHKGCCGHRIESGKYSTLKTYFVHPLLHTLKILAYILIINIIMGLVIHFVGEDNIADFMTKSGVLQPILVTLVGLIPNCASSVLITQLFLSDTISFGSCLGGLMVNAGLGIAFLFKENKNVKQNFAITFGLFGAALVVAIVFHYAFLNVL